MRSKLEQAAHLLAKARQDHQRITVAGEMRPRTLTEAYTLQDAIGRVLAPGGAQVRGWKVGAPNTETEPTAAPIYEVLSAPALIPSARLSMIGVEFSGMGSAAVSFPA